MDTRREARIEKLIRALKNESKLHIKDAARLLNVSEMTIRRDLSIESTPLTLLGGHIVASKVRPMSRYYLSERKAINVDEKNRIGYLAASLVKENDVVFFDSGTTTAFIAEAISIEIYFTAVCFSLNTFFALQDKPNCKVILCGGEFRAGTNIFIPFDKHSELEDICPDKAFISAAGVSLSHGLTCFSYDEVRVKKQALSISQQNILVVDHSKFGQIKPARFGSLSQIHCVVCENEPPEEYNEFFHTKNIKVL